MKQMAASHFVDRTLDNGLRVIIEVMPHVQSAAAGYLVRTGARDEIPELAGVSHFLEHMCFKGTPRRDWHRITIDFDNMGSTYNAYTSKERTFYFGWVRVEDLEKQIELLADMMRSVIPAEEFEMEKKVILEEIAMSADQIDRCVYDLIHEQLYVGHPLAWPVLGTTDTISKLSRDELHGYFEDRYHPGNMILLVAGNVDPDAALAMARRHSGDWKARAPRPRRATPPTLRSGTWCRKVERFKQQAVALAFPAPSATDPDRETADVLAAILGGHNSRFFWNIIQEGIAAHVAAGRIDYCDAAMMIAFGFCDPQRADELLAAMRAEIAKLCDKGVTNDEVQRVRNRTRTGLATEAEAPYYRLMQLVNDIDALGRPRDVTERLAAIDAVTPDSIRAYLRKWPMNGEGALTSLGPRHWPEKAVLVG